MCAREWAEKRGKKDGKVEGGGGRKVGRERGREGEEWRTYGTF